MSAPSSMRQMITPHRGIRLENPPLLYIPSSFPRLISGRGVVSVHKELTHVSIHKSLRTGGALTKHRNVLTRAERLKFLEDAGEWREERGSVLGLRKVKSIKA